MKVLGLLNSNVWGGRADIPEEDLFPNALQAPLAKALGEPVEIVARAVWPNPGIERIVGKWVDEVQPELVVFPIGAFWFLYESTPVRIERRFGRAGKWVSRKSQRVAGTPWFAHNPVFQWGRRQTQRAIGGQGWFEPDDVVERSTAVIRAVLQREGSYLIVMGPSGGEKWAANPEALARLAERRDYVDTRLREFCALHGVEYWDQAKKASIRDPRPALLQGDELHLSKDGHRRVAEYQFGLALGMVKRALASTRGEESAAHITARRS